MTKNEWIFLIKNTIRQGDETGLTRPGFLERHIQSVYEQMFNELYSSSATDIWHYVRDYSYTDPPDGSAADLSEGVTLSYLPIDLQRPSGGLFRAAIGSDSMVVTDYQGYLAASEALFDTADFKGKYVCAMRGGKFYANTTLADGGAVTYSIIPKFTTLELTDNVIIPGGAEDHFLDRVIMTIRQAQPEIDMLNDNA